MEQQTTPVSRPAYEPNEAAQIPPTDTAAARNTQAEAPVPPAAPAGSPYGGYPYPPAPLPVQQTYQQQYGKPYQQPYPVYVPTAPAMVRAPLPSPEKMTSAFRLGIASLVISAASFVPLILYILIRKTLQDPPVNTVVSIIFSASPIIFNIISLILGLVSRKIAKPRNVCGLIGWIHSVVMLWLIAMYILYVLLTVSAVILAFYALFSAAAHQGYTYY